MGFRSLERGIYIQKIKRFLSDLQEMDQNHRNGNSDSGVGSETLLPRKLFGVGREGEGRNIQSKGGGGEGGNTSRPQIYCHIYFHKWYL